MVKCKKAPALLAVAALALVATVLLAQTSATKPDASSREKLAIALKEVFLKNLDANTKEDMSSTLSTVHSESPVYAATEATMQQLFARYDLDYELLSFSYVGKDQDYAIARAKQKTTKAAGPAFRDNIIDALHIFRKEGNDWKLWQTAILDVDFLPQSSPGKSGRPGITGPATTLP